MTEIALISDIHANLPALEAVLDDLDARQPDMAFCLGDLVGYAPWPNEVIDELVVAAESTHRLPKQRRLIAVEIAPVIVAVCGDLIGDAFREIPGLDHDQLEETRATVRLLEDLECLRHGSDRIDISRNRLLMDTNGGLGRDEGGSMRHQLSIRLFVLGLDVLDVGMLRRLDDTNAFAVGDAPGRPAGGDSREDPSRGDSGAHLEPWCPRV